MIEQLKDVQIKYTTSTTATTQINDQNKTLDYHHISH